MPRLIDADALRNVFDAMHAIPGVSHFDHLVLLGIKKYIDDAPTIDAEPVRHGRWEWDEVDFEYTCSECKCNFDYSNMYGLFDHGFEYASYCPNCGAKMDGGAEE